MRCLTDVSVWLGHSTQTIWSNINPDVPLKVCFRWDYTISISIWVKQITLHNCSACLTSQLKALILKKTDLPQRGHFSSILPLELKINSDFSLALQAAGFGLTSLYNHMTDTTSILLVPSHWRTLTNIDFNPKYKYTIS